MKRFLLVSTFILIAAASMAQPKLPSKCKVWRPQELTKNLFSEKTAEQVTSEKSSYGQSVNTKTFWTVYSDRADNVTYMTPSTSGQKFSALEFNEELRIAQIENGMALVYAEKKITDYPKISEVAVCRGWVPMDRLLLWQSCPTDNQGIYYKALLCVNLDNVNDKTNVGFGYLAPDVKAQKVRLSTDMNFYFIMKRRNGMALLSTQSKMDGQYSSQVLYYWVPEQSYVPWNQRSCLEPTWKHDDVEYFAAKKIYSYVYANKELKGNWISRIPFYKKEPKSGKYEQYLYRMDGEKLRYPILDNGTPTVFNMSTFSTIGGEAAGTNSRQNGDPAMLIDASKKEELEKMMHINLGIVIDGTSSMEPYYHAVKEAIKEGVKYFSKNSKIKVGIVIYRDYTDGDAGLVEVMPMTSANNISRINAFLDSGGSYGIKSSPNDRTQTEALYCGMSTALDRLSYNKDESNIMLVIGDCGNDSSDNRYSKDDIIDKLISRKVSLMSFQVQNRNVVAYSLFNRQLTEMIRKSLLANYHAYDPEIKVSTMATKARDGFDYHGNSIPEIYVCSHRTADPSVNDGKMDPVKLTENMTSSIGGFAEAIQKQMDLIVSAGQSKPAKKPTTFGPNNGPSQDGIDISEKFLKERLGEAYVKALAESKSLINFKGYASRQDESGRDFYKPVILISQEEFDELLKRMSPVYEDAKKSAANDRAPFIEAMKALVKSFAPGMTDADLASLDNSQITRIIGGLNEAASSMKKYRLDDVSNRQVVTNQMYLSIINTFTRKYDNLKNIRQSKSYKYVKDFNGSRYYWIPIEDLP